MPQEEKKILIAVPTYRRPDGLKAALNSLAAIEMLKDVSVEVLVVENDTKENVRDIVAEFKRFPVYYVLEQRQGLVYVRNRILEEAKKLKADYLAGIDDDETVDKDWLVALWKGLITYDATVATGAVLSKFEIQPPQWIVRGNFFKTTSNRKTGKLLKRAATGNCIINLKFLDDKQLYFDGRFNFIGAEDTDFFSRVRDAGGKIVWVNEAITYESIPPQRLRLGYLLKRDFRIGLGRAMRFRKKSLLMGAIFGVLGLTIALFYTIILPFHWTKASFCKRLCKIYKQIGIFIGLFRIKIRVYGQNQQIKT